MSDLKLFRITADGVAPIPGSSMALEKSLQELMERNLDALLGIRFLASEHSTGAKHRGRIDTLGIDENGCPVIIEYKRNMNQNVINQGLFYLDWLLDHKAEFQLLVMKQCGPEVAEAIDWTGCRLLCIAGDFSRYDEYAVDQIHRNIELIRYTKYGDGLLLLDFVKTTVESQSESAAASTGGGSGSGSGTGKTYQTKAVADIIADLDTKTRDLYEAFKELLLSFGDDVRVKPTKIYVAFRRLKNFACVRPTLTKLTVWIKVDPDTVALEDGFTRDVREVGHYGTGDLELTIASMDDLARAEPLLRQSYEAN